MPVKKFDKNKEFTLQELGEEIQRGIQETGYSLSYQTNYSDQIVFKTNKSREDLYDSVIRYVKYLGFITQPLRKGKPEFKIPKSSLKFKRNRQIEIRVLPEKGLEYLKQGWENQNILDLKSQRKLPTQIRSSNPDNYSEYEVIKKFNEAIGDLSMEVTISGKVYRKVAGIVPGPFGSKADFVGVNTNGNPIFYISHKDGTTASDFQQYSGITRRGAGENISSHPEVKAFVEAIDETDKTELTESAHWRKIKDSKLKNYAIFGKNSDKGPAAAGYDNVDFFAQGKLILSTNNQTRRMKVNFSTALVGRNDLFKLGSGDYEPYLGARKGEVSRKVGKHSGIRGGIWTSKYIKDRNSTEI